MRWSAKGRTSRGLFKSKRQEILRFEVKLKDVRKIKDLLSNLDLVHERQLIGGITFKTLFSESIAKTILLDFYRKIYDNIAVPEKGILEMLARHILEDKNLGTGSK